MVLIRMFQGLFSLFEVTEIRETTLGANQWLDEFEAKEKYVWNVKGGGSVVNNKASAAPRADEITLNPMQIRTFVVKVAANWYWWLRDVSLKRNKTYVANLSSCLISFHSLGLDGDNNTRISLKGTWLARSVPLIPTNPFHGPASPRVKGTRSAVSFGFYHFSILNSCRTTRPKILFTSISMLKRHPLILKRR